MELCLDYTVNGYMTLCYARVKTHRTVTDETTRPRFLSS